MPTSCTQRTALAVLYLVLVSVLAPPVLAQSASNAGGGAQASSKESAADKQTAQRVYDKLNADKVDYYKHVTVTAANGVVTLGGSVESAQALNKAKKIAGGVQGVTKVVDQMEVERAPARPSPGH
jgi:hyperosmotically inducible periplasmic protein